MTTEELELRAKDNKGGKRISRKYASIGGFPHKERLYFVWAQMRDRCFNPKNKQYKNYGGRGIFVCDEWDRSYLSFREWAHGNGYRQGLTIDRKNKQVGYIPSNCEWITRQENSSRQSKASVHRDSITTLLLTLGDLEAGKKSGLWPDIYADKSIGELWMSATIDWLKEHGIGVVND